MKKLLSVLVAIIGLSLIMVDADAASRRLGGGSSAGKQRDSVTQKQAAPKAPAQQQQAAPPAPAPQPSGMSKWLGPLAGLALGAGLAALFMNNGLAGALGGILMLLAIGAIAFFAFRMLRSRMGGQPAQYAGAGAGGGQQPVTDASPDVRREMPQQAPRSAIPLGGGAAPGSVAATLSGQPVASQWPAGFDADGFVRQAKLNFVRLQDAHGSRDVAAIRDFLTPELFNEIESGMRAQGEAPQKIEVVTLTGEVIDVVEENGQYIVSVKFSGLIREAPGEAPQPFSETWHLEKPVSGISGWLLSGIQQN